MFAIVGAAILAVFRPSLRPPDLLTAPGLGFAAMLLPATWLTRSGAAADRFGVPLVTVLVLGSLATLAFRRLPVSALRSVLPPAIASVAATLFVIGLPQLHYGFDWLSFSNDDMANYSLDAARLLRLPEYAMPQLANLLSLRHPDEWTWFLFARFGERYGFDLVLATISNLVGQTPFELYMSLELALYAALSLALAAVMSAGRSAPAVAAIAAIAAIVTLAPTNAVSVYYQLGPQIAGVLMVAVTFYYFVREPERKWRGDIAGVTIAGLGFAGLLQSYPEVIPILWAAIIAWAVRLALPLRRPQVESLGRHLTRWGFATLAGVAALGFAGVNSLELMFAKARIGATVPRGGFEVSVTPSGISSLFGLSPVDIYAAGVTASPAIAFGIALFAFTFFSSLRSVARKDPADLLALMALVLIVPLIVTRNGYGAFKAILYSSPFVFATLARAALRIRLPRVPGLISTVACVGVLAATMGPTLLTYIVRSDDALPQAGSTYTQIPTASATHLLGTLRGLRSSLGNQMIISDSYTESLAKFENGLLAGHSMLFPSHNTYLTLDFVGSDYPDHLLPLRQMRELSVAGTALRNEVHRRARVGAKLPETIGCCSVEFSVPREPPITSDAALLYQGPHFTVLNRSSELPKTTAVGAVRYAAAKNVLIFVDSSLGNSPSFGRTAAIFQPEPDFFYPGRSMSAVGRYLLFEVIHPDRPRLEIWLTRSLNAAGNVALPHSITVYGTKTASVALAGDGSTRVVTPELEPFKIAGHAYIVVDLGAAPAAFGVDAGGLIGLFNGDLISDPRKIVGYARDISMLDASEIAKAPIPETLSQFPGDLATCCTQFSGIYEDGWVSSDSWYDLRSDHTTDALVIEGNAVDGIASNRVRIALDGRQVLTRSLVPGTFGFTLPIPQNFGPGIHRIAIHFTRSRRLGSGDARSAAAQLKRVGFYSD